MPHRPSKPADRRSAPPPGRPAAPPGLTDAELQELDAALQAVPAPLVPLDFSAVDGFLVGVLLQPRRPSPRQWWPFVVDEEGRPWPHHSRASAGAGTGAAAEDRLRQLVLRRFDELDTLIEARQWFDPWVEAPESEDTSPHEAVAAWVLGFATACGHFPALTDQSGPEFDEALAEIYQHLDVEDLEEAESLVQAIEMMEPPASLDEAVESLVRGTLLLADISRPRRQGPAPARGRR